MRSSLQTLLCGSLLILSSACAGSWKIGGGPAECLRTCQEWGMELQGMVAVGSQGSSQARGATACVCQPQNGKAISQNAIGAATTAALAGAIEEQREREEEEARHR